MRGSSPVVAQVGSLRDEHSGDPGDVEGISVQVSQALSAEVPADKVASGPFSRSGNNLENGCCYTQRVLSLVRR